MHAAVAREDSLGHHALDRLGDELDVGARQRRQVVRAEQHALAAERVVGPHLPAQLRIAQLRAHERGRAQARDAPDRARVANRRGDRLAVLEHEVAPQLLHARHAFDRRLDPSRVATVAPRQHPVSRALEDRQPRRLRGDLGDELHRARAGPDDRHALARQRIVVVPTRRMEAVPGERVDPLDRRRRRLVQLARRKHQRVGRVALSLVRVDQPARSLLVPRARADRPVQLDVALDVVGARRVEQVLVDLRLRRAQPRPVAALRERERVQVAGHVAGRARVAVVVPRPARRLRALEDRHVVDPVALALDRRGDAAEAGADDHDRQRSGPALLCTHGGYG